MVTEFVNSGQIEVVCKCFKGLDQMGHNEALTQVSLAIAKMGRPDIIAKVTSSLAPDVIPEVIASSS